MTFNTLLLWLMALGILVGAMDRIFGNKLGLGEQFEEGFNAMGPLALGLVGIVTLAPVIANVLGPVIIPVFGLASSGNRSVGRSPRLYGRSKQRFNYAGGNW